MGLKGRRMAQPNFLDLAESNGVPHAQIGEGRVDPPKKGLGYSPGGAILASEPDPGFYAWNRSLGVPGVSSWGPTAKATPSLAPRR